MSVQIHLLEGCAPAPLAHYLKGLAVLRLVAEQKDAAARGFWKADRFHLATVLDQNGLERFFLEEYVPTPLLAPWNGGSGFYPKDNKSGFEPMSHAAAPRFAPYRQAIALAEELVGDRDERPMRRRQGRDDPAGSLLLARRATRLARCGLGVDRRKAPGSVPCASRNRGQRRPARFHEQSNAAAGGVVRRG